MATEAACRYIQQETGFHYYLESGFSSDRKPSRRNLMNGRGHSVTVEYSLSGQILDSLGVRQEAILEFQQLAMTSSQAIGMLGNNVHLANALDGTLPCHRAGPGLRRGKRRGFQPGLAGRRRRTLDSHDPALAHRRDGRRRHAAAGAAAQPRVAGLWRRHSRLSQARAKSCGLCRGTGALVVSRSCLGQALPKSHEERRANRVASNLRIPARH